MCSNPLGSPELKVGYRDVIDPRKIGGPKNLKNWPFRQGSKIFGRGFLQTAGYEYMKKCAEALFSDFLSKNSFLVGGGRCGRDCRFLGSRRQN